MALVSTINTVRCAVYIFPGGIFTKFFSRAVFLRNFSRAVVLKLYRADEIFTGWSTGVLTGSFYRRFWPVIVTGRLNRLVAKKLGYLLARYNYCYWCSFDFCCGISDSVSLHVICSISYAAYVIYVCCAKNWFHVWFQPWISFFVFAARNGSTFSDYHVDNRNNLGCLHGEQVHEHQI